MFGSYNIEDEIKKKTKKYLEMILSEIEKQKDAPKKELTVIINPSVALKIDEEYIINALRRKKFKVHKLKDEKVGACAFKIIWQ